MNCQDIREKELIETYVAGRLSGALLEEVESHYFGCDRCASYLRECRIAQTALRERADEIRAESRKAERAWPRWLPAMAMAAAALLAAVLFWPRGTPFRPTVKLATAQSYAQLAKVDPPRYEPMLLRGTKDPSGEQFQSAMQNYVRGDYSTAAAALSKVVAVNGEAAEPRFYLAVSELLSGKSREAIDEFLRVIHLGDRRFVEQSQFHLAKAWLQQDRPDAAREQLLPLAAGQGEFAAAARTLLTSLRDLAGEDKK